MGGVSIRVDGSSLYEELVNGGFVREDYLLFAEDLELDNRAVCLCPGGEGGYEVAFAGCEIEKVTYEWPSWRPYERWESAG